MRKCHLGLTLSLALLPCTAACPPVAVEGEGEGEGSEGEGERYTVEQRFLHLAGGVLVDDPLPSAAADASDDVLLAAGAGADGVPVLVGAEVVDGALSGAIVVVVDPLGAATSSTIPDAFEEASPPALQSTAALADLDGDGDLDVIVRVQSRVFVLSRVSGVFSVLGQRSFDGSGSAAIADVDGDALDDVLLAGLNGDSLLVRAPGGVVGFAVAHQLWQVDDLGYCSSAFGAAGGAPFALGEVCARFGSTSGGPPNGPDRLFAVAGTELEAVASIDSGLEGASRVLAGAAGSVIASGYRFDPSLDRVGPLRAVIADAALTGVNTLVDDAEVRALADVRGDGTATPLVWVRAGGEVPAGAVGVDAGDSELLFGPFVVDVDGDGIDDAVFARAR